MSAQTKLPFRQIHMDFHTGEQIDPICAAFDPEEFASTLEKARVNSVTCFAACHHGMLYYDSKVFPEMVHPGLKDKDLLIRQIEACHRRGIHVPIYITVQWNYHQSRRHPEWLCFDEHGRALESCASAPSETFGPGFYRTLCINTGYREFVKALTLDVLDSVPVTDGIFFDITCITDCSCSTCVRKMKEQGYDPTDKEQRILFAKKSMEEFKAELSELVRSKQPDASIFYNCGHIGPYIRGCLDSYSHLELESLPSGGWGYTHFSNTVRYARTLGLDLLGQTGKFHTAWGDFHSFKNVEALSYECFRMLAFGTKCLIGDQLEPDGRISQPVYDLVGSVYSEVEKKEPWCVDAVPVCDIALFTSESWIIPTGTGGEVPAPVCGAASMLEELGCQFDIVDDQSDLSGYRLLILPDEILLSDALRDKIRAFLAGGGKLLATGTSGLAADRTDFALEEMGIKYIGEAPYSPDFIFPNEVIGKKLPKTEHVMYLRGQQVEAVSGQILMDTRLPYFNRTWEHFCSHLHTPSSHQTGYPAAVMGENVIYLAHPVFSTYQLRHPKWCREIVDDAITLLMPDRLVRHNGPTSLLVCLNEQPAEKRYVLHLLHYIPEKRCDKTFTIENVIPVYHIPMTLSLPKSVSGISVVFGEESLPYIKNADGSISFTVPKVDGHTMLTLHY